MQYKPFKDPKFVVALVDAVVFVAQFLLGRYLPAATYDVVNTVWLAFQPVVGIVLAQMFVAQSQELKAGKSLGFFK
jgi:uncharacterized membrane protein